MDIINDILKTIKNGNNKKTHIMYRANMSFAQRNEYLSLLENKGLIESIENNNGDIRYVVSEKGNEFLKYKKIIDNLINS